MTESLHPAHLYHGSCQGIEGCLAPRPNHGDINGAFPEGPRNVVFATHEKDLAALYTLKTKHMLSAGVINGMNFSFFRDYDSWHKEISRAACNVYELPPETFINTLKANSGTPSIEWQSPVSVAPTRAIHQTPESVMESGSQLFFLDAKVKPELWHYDPSVSVDSSFMNRFDAKCKSGALPESFSMLNLARELIDAGIMTHLNVDASINPVALEKSPHGDVIKEDIEWLKSEMAKTKIWTTDPRNQSGRRSGDIILG